MALIICPECGKQFSDKAQACPECGCPTSEITGSTSQNDHSGEKLLANNAFEDGRYDEAYQLFSQIYSKSQEDSNVLIRLGLATAAKDCLENGVPKSTKDLIIQGLTILKTDSDFNSKLSTLFKDLKSVSKYIDDTVEKMVSDMLSGTTPMRSNSSIIIGGLFDPVNVAKRNSYEDEKTLNKNNQIIDQATKYAKNIYDNKSILTNLICSLIKEIIGESNLSQDNKNELIIFNVVDELDNPYNVCSGEEYEIFTIDNVNAGRVKNGKNLGGTILFSEPKGKVIITNYKISYTCANKPNFTFTQSIKDLTNIIDDRPFKQIKFVLFDGMKIYITLKNVNDIENCLNKLNETIVR